MALALDASKWGGDITREEAECFKAEGVDTVILASGPGGYSQNFKIQADDVVAAGLNLEVYAFLEWGSDPEWWIRQALVRTGDYFPLIKRFWVDVEDNHNPAPATLSERINYVQKALNTADAITNQHTGIYTGGWYWKRSNQMANTDVFAKQGRLLWNSFYDNDPDIDGLPYGGWTEDTVAIEQFTGTVDFCGQSVDTNWIYIYPEGENGDDDMADARLREVLGWRYAIAEYAHGLLQLSDSRDAAVVKSVYDQLVSEGKITPLG